MDTFLAPLNHQFLLVESVLLVKIKFLSFSGLKYLLKQMGVFVTDARYADYPLPDAVKQDIDALLAEERKTRLPYVQTRNAKECRTQTVAS